MKIKIELEIEHCYQCPFKKKVYEQGYSAFDCSKLGPYRTILDKGIRNDCPFRKEEVEKYELSEMPQLLANQY